MKTMKELKTTKLVNLTKEESKKIDGGGGLLCVVAVGIFVYKVIKTVKDNPPKDPFKPHLGQGGNSMPLPNR